MNAEFSHAEPYGRAHLILMLREKMFLQRRRQNRNDHIRRRRIHLIDDGIQIPHTIFQCIFSRQNQLRECFLQFRFDLLHVLLRLSQHKNAPLIALDPPIEFI